MVDWGLRVLLQDKYIHHQIIINININKMYTECKSHVFCDIIDKLCTENLVAWTSVQNFKVNIFKSNLIFSAFQFFYAQLEVV